MPCELGTRQGNFRKDLKTMQKEISTRPENKQLESAKERFYSQAESLRKKLEKLEENDKIGGLIINICDAVAVALTSDITITEDEMFSVFTLITNFAKQLSLQEMDRATRSLQIEQIIPQLVIATQNYAILRKLSDIK